MATFLSLLVAETELKYFAFGFHMRVKGLCFNMSKRALRLLLRRISTTMRKLAWDNENVITFSKKPTQMILHDITVIYGKVRIHLKEFIKFILYCRVMSKQAYTMISWCTCTSN